jgi:hypothetical protein
MLDEVRRPLFFAGVLEEPGEGAPPLGKRLRVE